MKSASLTWDVGRKVSGVVRDELTPFHKKNVVVVPVRELFVQEYVQLNEPGVGQRITVRLLPELVISWETEFHVIH